MRVKHRGGSEARGGRAGGPGGWRFPPPPRAGRSACGGGGSPRRGCQGLRPGRSARPARPGGRRRCARGGRDDRAALGGAQGRRRGRAPAARGGSGRRGRQPLLGHAVDAGVRAGKRSGGRGPPRGGGRSEHRPARGRDGADDRGTHRQRAGHPHAARQRRRPRGPRGLARADRPDVGRRGGPPGRRAHPDRARGQCRRAVRYGLVGAAVRGPGGQARGRACAARCRRRRERHDSAGPVPGGDGGRPGDPRRSGSGQ